MTLLVRENIHTKIAMDNVIAEFGCLWEHLPVFIIMPIFVI